MGEDHVESIAEAENVVQEHLEKQESDPVDGVFYSCRSNKEEKQDIGAGDQAGDTVVEGNDGSDVSPADNPAEPDAVQETTTALEDQETTTALEDAVVEENQETSVPDDGSPEDGHDDAADEAGGSGDEVGDEVGHATSANDESLLVDETTDRDVSSVAETGPPESGGLDEEELIAASEPTEAIHDPVNGEQQVTEGESDGQSTGVDESTTVEDETNGVNEEPVASTGDGQNETADLSEEVQDTSEDKDDGAGVNAGDDAAEQADTQENADTGDSGVIADETQEASEESDVNNERTDGVPEKVDEEQGDDNVDRGIEIPASEETEHGEPASADEDVDASGGEMSDDVSAARYVDEDTPDVSVQSSGDKEQAGEEDVDATETPVASATTSQGDDKLPEAAEELLPLSEQSSFDEKTTEAVEESPEADEGTTALEVSIQQESDAVVEEEASKGEEGKELEEKKSSILVSEAEDAGGAVDETNNADERSFVGTPDNSSGDSLLLAAPPSDETENKDEEAVGDDDQVPSEEETKNNAVDEREENTFVSECLVSQVEGDAENDTTVEELGEVSEQDVVPVEENNITPVEESQDDRNLVQDDPENAGVDSLLLQSGEAEAEAEADDPKPEVAGGAVQDKADGQDVEQAGEDQEQIQAEDSIEAGDDSLLLQSREAEVRNQVSEDTEGDVENEKPVSEDPEIEVAGGAVHDEADDKQAGDHVEKEEEQIEAGVVNVEESDVNEGTEIAGQEEAAVQSSREQVRDKREQDDADVDEKVDETEERAGVEESAEQIIQTESEAPGNAEVLDAVEEQVAGETGKIEKSKEEQVAGVADAFEVTTVATESEEIEEETQVFEEPETGGTSANTVDDEHDVEQAEDQVENEEQKIQDGNSSEAAVQRADEELPPQGEENQEQDVGDGEPKVDEDNSEERTIVDPEAAQQIIRTESDDHEDAPENGEDFNLVEEELVAGETENTEGSNNEQVSGDATIENKAAEEGATTISHESRADEEIDASPVVENQFADDQDVEEAGDHEENEQQIFQTGNTSEAAGQEEAAVQSVGEEVSPQVEENKEQEDTDGEPKVEEDNTLAEDDPEAAERIIETEKSEDVQGDAEPENNEVLDLEEQVARETENTEEPKEEQVADDGIMNNEAADEGADAFEVTTIAPESGEDEKNDSGEYDDADAREVDLGANESTDVVEESIVHENEGLEAEIPTQATTGDEKSDKLEHEVLEGAEDENTTENSSPTLEIVDSNGSTDHKQEEPELTGEDTQVFEPPGEEQAEVEDGANVVNAAVETSETRNTEEPKEEQVADDALIQNQDAEEVDSAFEVSTTAHDSGTHEETDKGDADAHEVDLGADKSSDILEESSDLIKTAHGLSVPESSTTQATTGNEAETVEKLEVELPEADGESTTKDSIPAFQDENSDGSSGHKKELEVNGESAQGLEAPGEDQEAVEEDVLGVSIVNAAVETSETESTEESEEQVADVATIQNEAADEGEPPSEVTTESGADEGESSGEQGDANARKVDFCAKESTDVVEESNGVIAHEDGELEVDVPVLETSTTQGDETETVEKLELEAELDGADDENTTVNTTPASSSKLELHGEGTQGIETSGEEQAEAEEREVNIVTTAAETIQGILDVHGAEGEENQTQLKQEPDNKIKPSAFSNIVLAAMNVNKATKPSKKKRLRLKKELAKLQAVST